MQTEISGGRSSTRGSKVGILILFEHHEYLELILDLQQGANLPIPAAPALGP